jgi:hypothetical protein
MGFLRGAEAPKCMVEWKQNSIGGGGLLLHVVCSNDGETILTNGDVGGLWRYESGSDTFTDLSKSDHMPPLVYQGSRSPGMTAGSGGFSAVAIAPSDSDVIYAIWRGSGITAKPSVMVRSTDRGETFEICDGFTLLDDTANVWLGPNNANQKYWWNKIGIDPSDPDVIYAPHPGTGRKPRMSIDGGATFTPISGLPDNPSGNIGSAMWAIDPTSAIVGGRHQRIIVCIYQDGFYETTDGGATWTEIYDYTGALGIDSAAFGPDGVYFVSIINIGVRRYQGGTWTTILSHASPRVAVHQTVAGQIAILNAGSAIYFSADHGATFTGGGGSYNTSTEVSIVGTPGWQELQQEANNMGGGTVRMINWNPGVTNELWVCNSQGLCKGIVDGVSATLEFSVCVKGIEELVGNMVMCVPGKSHINMLNWDEWGFKKTKTDEGLQAYPDDASRPPAANSWGSLYFGWHCASDPQNPDILVTGSSPSDGNGYSDDGGETWNDYGTPITIVGDGKFTQVAVNDGVTLYTSRGGGAWPLRSEDLGTTWDQLDYTNFSGMTDSTYSGFSGGSNWQYQSIVADPVDPDVFYAFNIYTAAVSPTHYTNHQGFWKSTDRGQNFTRIHSSLIASNTYTQWTRMHAVPGNEGHLFMVAQTSNAFTEGFQASFAGFDLYRTTDGGDTISIWSSDIKNVDGFGFGKALTTGGYPTIYFSGFYKGSYGVYQVTNNDLATIRRYWSTRWKRWPLGRYASNGHIQTITGDWEIFGRIYLAFGGHGFAYADLV